MNNVLSDKQAKADQISGDAEDKFDALIQFVYDRALDLDLTVEEGKKLIEKMVERALDAGQRI